MAQYDEAWLAQQLQKPGCRLLQGDGPGSMMLTPLPQPFRGEMRDNSRLGEPQDTRVALTLPFPPGVNTWLIPVERRLVKSPAHRQYVHDVGWAAKQQYHGPLLTGLLTMTVAYHPPDHRAYDIDRGCKAVLDGLEQIIYINDKQVKRLLLTMDEVTQPGYVHVTIQERRPFHARNGIFDDGTAAQAGDSSHSLRPMWQAP